MRRLVTAGSARWRRTRLLGRIVGAHRFRPITHQHRTTLLTACQETRQAVAIRTATARIGPLRAARISNSPQPIPPGKTQVTKASARFARNDVTAGHHTPAHSTPGDRPAHHDPAGYDPSRHRPAGHDPPITLPPTTPPITRPSTATPTPTKPGPSHKPDYGYGDGDDRDY